MFKHLGPIIRCENKLTDTVKKIKTCSNKDCKNHGKIKDQMFCEICATRIDSVVIPISEKLVDHWAVSEILEEALYHLDNPLQGPLVDYWAPNVPRNNPRNFSLNFNDHLNITSMNPQQEETWIKEAFAKEIQILKNVYGQNNVTVQWGMVTGDN